MIEREFKIHYTYRGDVRVYECIVTSSSFEESCEKFYDLNSDDGAYIIFKSNSREVNV